MTKKEREKLHNAWIIFAKVCTESVKEINTPLDKRSGLVLPRSVYDELEPFLKAVYEHSYNVGEVEVKATGCVSYGAVIGDKEAIIDVKSVNEVTTLFTNMFLLMNEILTVPNRIKREHFYKKRR